MSQFATPATSSSIDFQQLKGSLLMVKVIFLEEHIPTAVTKPGERSPAIRADVTVLDGPHAGEHYADTLIFPKVLQSQLRSRVGQLVLGRLGQGPAKPGQSAPWQLDAATSADEQVATGYLAKQATPSTTSVATEQPPF
jgi:hypothetical protein